MKYLVVISYLLLAPFLGQAQEVHQELQETVRAEVIKIISEEVRDVIGTDIDTVVQEVLVEIRSGERVGERASFETDLMRLSVGDHIYVNRLISIDGVEYYNFKDADRTVPLTLLLVLFAGVLWWLSGYQGLRALASLGLSVLILLFVLVPLLLNGYSPAWVSILVAGPMLAVTLFLTHGFHTRVWMAFWGTFGAVIATCALAATWVSFARFTGLTSDASVYLNFSTQGSLDFGGLLLGSIIIGILGVLDDVAITQASVVRELKEADPTLPFRGLYMRALRVGRDHVGSLVNTLAFAYMGTSLPLVLLLAKANSDIVFSLNQETVAVELVRIFVGSIGLMLAVPFTTLIAAWWYEKHLHEENGGEHHHYH